MFTEIVFSPNRAPGAAIAREGSSSTRSEGCRKTSCPAGAGVSETPTGLTLGFFPTGAPCPVRKVSESNSEEVAPVIPSRLTSPGCSEAGFGRSVLAGLSSRISLLEVSVNPSWRTPTTCSPAVLEVAGGTRS